MKIPAMLSGITAAFLTASASIAETPNEPVLLYIPGSVLEKTTAQRYKTIKYSAEGDVLLPEERSFEGQTLIEAYLEMQEERGPTFNASEFYYAHIYDNQKKQHILCSGMLTVAPTELPLAPPDFFPPNQYTSSETVERLWIQGETINSVTQHGSCMSVNPNELTYKNVVIETAQFGKGHYIPVHRNEAESIDHDAALEKLTDVYNKAIIALGELVRDGEISYEDFDQSQAGHILFQGLLRTKTNYLDIHALGTNSNKETCENAGYIGDTIFNIRAGRHDDSELPLCGHLDFN